MEDIKPKTAETKPNVDGGANGDDENISLTVADQSGGAPVQFRIKKTTPLRKLMDAYCKKLGLSKQAVRFTFDGNRLREQDTPKASGIDDGDEIDVFQEQQGGGETIDLKPQKDETKGLVLWCLGWFLLYKEYFVTCQVE